MSGFYIQETEVTNEEIEDFAKANPDVPFNEWTEGLKRLIDSFKKPREDVLKYPAVFINRTTAQRYAQSVGGTLPTEAEWEYVARGRGQDCLWAGKNQRAKKTAPQGSPLLIRERERYRACRRQVLRRGRRDRSEGLRHDRQRSRVVSRRLQAVC